MEIPGHLKTESDGYRRARDELLEAEVALRDQRERVAELRRALPQDTAVPSDYELTDADGRSVRLSDLVGERPLVLVHFMYGGAQTTPCPMCTLWADGYDGVTKYLTERFDFGVLMAADIADARHYAAEQGWPNVRLFSSAGSELKRDLAFEDDAGNQLPGVSVFVRRDGEVRHFYSASAIMDVDEGRGMDLLSPVWGFLDLTPEGRGDWVPPGEDPPS